MQKIVLYPCFVNKIFSCDFSYVYKDIISTSQEHAHFFLLNRYKNRRMSRVRSSLKKIAHNAKISYLNYAQHLMKYEKTESSKRSKISYSELKEIVESELITLSPDKVIFTHGHCFDKYSNELRMFEKFKQLKKEDSDIITNFSDYLFDIYFTLTFMEACAKFNIEVENLWFDPLQAKYEYIANLDIRHWYFHPQTEMMRPGVYEKYKQKYDTHATDFRSFDYMQSHAYMSNQIDELRSIKENYIDKNLISYIEESKEYFSVFGMSHAWNNSCKFREVFLLNVQMKFINEEMNDKGYYYCYRSRLFERLEIEPESELNPFLSFDDYLSKIKKSYTTLILPAMDERQFSSLRFVESLSLGCIPLITSNAEYLKGFAFDSQILNVYQSHGLIIDVSEIESNPKAVIDDIRARVQYVFENYPTILREIYSTNFVRDLLNNALLEQTLKIMLSKHHPVQHTSLAL